MADEKPKLRLADIPSAHFPIVTDLPPSIYRKIGKVISAHAFLETQLVELLFELSRMDYSIGRVVVRYQSASEQFKLARRLLVLHGVSTTMGLKPLLQQIEQSCKIRDSFAHGVWVRDKDGEIGLRLTKGEYELPGGRADRAFVPQNSTFSAEFCEKARHDAIEIGFKLAYLREKIGAELAKRPAKSEPQSPPK